jgi:hypothetical protein
MTDTIPHPQCGAAAEITKRFWLDSTDGRIEHLRTGCLSKHWFTPRPETVQASRWPPRSATRRAVTKLTRSQYCRRSRRAAPRAW